VKYDAQINLNKKKLLLLKKKISDAQNKKRSLRKFYHELGITKMPNLPGTLSEVQTISKIVKKSEIVTGYDVTENKIKEMSEKGVLKDYKVLHFAVHGLTVPSFPELSAIVLSLLNEDKNGEDGFLSMSEIVELNIESDFVNLSACETGLGKIYEGDGVVGLTQAFIVAGSNSVSVSLWPVADESTALFMSRLYQINSENNSSYDRCITEVKREFISGKHGSVLKAPFFWAPFVYYGK
jgi:CHAT domain-containing protein